MLVPNEFPAIQKFALNYRRFLVRQRNFAALTALLSIAYIAYMDDVLGLYLTALMLVSTAAQLGFMMYFHERIAQVDGKLK